MYVPLNKLYYSEPDKYEEYYSNRFNSDGTIKLNISIHGCTAFIVQDYEMFQTIAQIQKTNTGIREYSMQLPQLAINQFSKRCLIDEVVVSNDIEGVNSTRREIHDALDILADKSDLEKHPHFKGLVSQYLNLSAGGNISLTRCEDIRAIYDELVLPEVVEENPQNKPDGRIFRRGAVEVANSAQKAIHQGVYPESEIISSMDKSLQMLNDAGIDPLIRISAFHYLFGFIHPFYDGNGRLSRFISSYLLSKELDPLIGYRLSYTIKENPGGYYDAFKICNDPKNRGDLTPFVRFFLDIILRAMQQLEYALGKRFSDLERYRKASEVHPLINEKNEHIIYLLIQALLFAEYGISTTELKECTGLSYATLKKRLDELKDAGLAENAKIGKQMFYKCVLKALSE